MALIVQKHDRSAAPPFCIHPIWPLPLLILPLLYNSRVKIYVLLLIYPFGFILLAVLPFIGAISRLYAMAQIATAAAEDDAFLIICPSETCPAM